MIDYAFESPDVMDVPLTHQQQKWRREFFQIVRNCIRKKHENNNVLLSRANARTRTLKFSVIYTSRLRRKSKAVCCVARYDAKGIACDPAMQIASRDRIDGTTHAVANAEAPKSPGPISPVLSTLMTLVSTQAAARRGSECVSNHSRVS